MGGQGEKSVSQPSARGGGLSQVADAPSETDRCGQGSLFQGRLCSSQACLHCTSQKHSATSASVALSQAS